MAQVLGEITPSHWIQQLEVPAANFQQQNFFKKFFSGLAPVTYITFMSSLYVHKLILSVSIAFVSRCTGPAAGNLLLEPAANFQQQIFSKMFFSGIEPVIYIAFVMSLFVHKLKLSVSIAVASRCHVPAAGPAAGSSSTSSRWIQQQMRTTWPSSWLLPLEPSSKFFQKRFCGDFDPSHTLLFAVRFSGTIHRFA